MKRQFLHDLSSSFTLWFEHTLLKEGQAFTNTSGSLYNTRDSVFSSYTIYASPYKQWVYDSSISGAIIPSGIYVGNTFVPRGDHGMRIDYQNGRVMWPTGSSNWNVSGAYAVKDFNIYRTTSSEEDLLFNNKFVFNPKFPQGLTGIDANAIVLPAIFLKLTNSSNNAFEFGGTDETTAHMRAIILSNTEFDVDAVGNIFTDQKYNNFPLFPKTPLNEFNDVKGGYYNYNDYLNTYFAYNKIPYISQVGYSRLLTVGVNSIDPNLDVGFLDFEIKQPRIT